MNKTPDSPRLARLQELDALLPREIRGQSQIIPHIVSAVRRGELGLTMLFIAHEMSVVRHMSRRVAVMYLGRIVETGTTDEIFGSARHPYTQGLLGAVPRLEPVKRRRQAMLQGDVPSPYAIPAGCRFHTRCPKAADICRRQAPPRVKVSATHEAECHFAG